MDERASSPMPVVVVLGRQGSGKGEQAARLAARRGFDHVSTGAVLRAAARAKSAVGRSAERYLDRGDPVPDDVVNGVVAERIALAAAEGRAIVLDGYPRSVAQAERLAELVRPGTVDLVLHLDVPRHVAVTRIEDRRVCTVCDATGTGARCVRCGGPTTRRADDDPYVIGRRMSDYARHMDALLRWYEAGGVLRTVDGVGSVDSVAERVEAVLAERLDPVGAR